MERHRPGVSEVESSLRQSARLQTAAVKAANPSNFCQYCAAFRIPRTRPRCGNKIYARSLEDALEAAEGQSVCGLCSFLTDRIKLLPQIVQDQVHMTISLHTSRYTEVYGSWNQPTQLALKIGRDQLLRRYDVCELTTESTGDDPGAFDGKYLKPHQENYPRYLSHLPRIVNSNPLSEATIGLAKDWLESCRSHSYCRAQEPRPLPTRVVDIRGDSLKVIESEGLSGSYVALSHCWGSTDETFSTTKKNIEKRKTLGVKLSELPLNFHHAILFTRRLGCDYIWIDSLCILQQDVQDWQHEAGRMAAYYNNAFLTLAIADAMNCHVGFLRSRRHHYSPPIAGDNGESYCLREELPGRYSLNNSSWISERAWTLQECLLSPRVIYFTRNQMLWHCRETEWAEGYIQVRYPHREEYLSNRAGRLIDRAEYDTYLHRKFSPEISYRKEFDTDFAAHTWYDCVSEFSSRYLTRASDKLAAIAGLASMFSQPELGKYMAGHWEKDLFRGLTWMRVKPAEQTGKRYQWFISVRAKRNLAARAYKPPPEYQAPSWSWASVNAPVGWHDPLVFFKNRAAFKPTVHEVEHWETHFGPHLVSHNLLHSGGYPYVDMLEGSFIEVKGKYRKLWISTVRLSSEADGPDGTFIKNILLDQDTPDQMFAYLTQPDQSDHQACKELLILQISKEYSGDRLVYALLLEQMQDPESGFQRIGLVELACYNLCEDFSPRDPGRTNSQDYVKPMRDPWYHFKKEHYETKEWQEDRWQEGTLKLF